MFTQSYPTNSLHRILSFIVIYPKIKAITKLKYGLFHTSRSFNRYTIKSLNEGILYTYMLGRGYVLKNNIRNVEITVKIACMMSVWLSTNWSYVCAFYKCRIYSVSCPLLSALVWIVLQHSLFFNFFSFLLLFCHIFCHLTNSTYFKVLKLFKIFRKFRRLELSFRIFSKFWNSEIFHFFWQKFPIQSKWEKVQSFTIFKRLLLIHTFS